jgi:hypothetical protein
VKQVAIEKGVFLTPKDEVTRRSFLRTCAAGVAIAGLGIVDSTVINAASNGTLHAHANSIFDIPVVAPAAGSRNTAYEVTGRVKDVASHETWNRVLFPGLDILYTWYFGITRNEGIEMTADLFDRVQVPYQTGFALLSLWGKHKIANNWGILREKLTNIAQTQIATRLDILGMMLSSGGIRQNTLRWLVSESTFGGMITSHKLNYRRMKGTISTRTVGVFDKEPINYATAITHALISGYDLGFLPEELKQTAVELANVKGRVDALRVASGSRNTELDGELLSVSHKVEKSIVSIEHQPNAGIGLTAAVLGYHQSLIQAYFTNNWHMADLSPWQQGILLSWNTHGSDLSPYQIFDKHFNPQLDSFAEPQVIIPHVIEETLRIAPDLGQMQSEAAPEEVVTLFRKPPLNSAYPSFVRSVAGIS